MIFDINIRYLLRTLLLLPLVIAMGGCTMVEEPGTPCPVGNEDYVRFDFRVVSSNIRDNITERAYSKPTRTDDQGHEEVDSEWPAFENAIDVNNFAFYVFLGTEEEAPLLMKVTDIAKSKDPDMMITGSNGAYTISMVIAKSKLEELLGRELDPGSNEAMQFRVVGVANIQNSNAEWSQELQIYNNVPCSTYKELVENAAKWTYDMSQVYSPNEGEHTLTLIYKNQMPMYGTMVMTTTESELYHSRYDNRIWFGTMWMLRSLAKVKVADKIQSKDAATNLPRVGSAEFVGTASSLYVLPYNAIGYVNEQQVHTPNICTDAGQTSSSTQALGSYYLGSYPAGSDTFIAYVPEQNIEGDTPCFKVTVIYKEHPDPADASKMITDISEDYIVPMTGYKDQVINFGTSILRNHIYTLQVDDARYGFPAEISIDVADWAEETLTLDYTENVAVSNELSWTEGYSSLNAANAYVITQPWHDDQPVQLVGTFGISNPVGAIWTASLITTEGATGAFLFVDSEGNQVETVSGEVDGETLSTIRIVTRDPAPQQRNAALLQVVVSLNGHYMEVPLYTDKKFQIIQNPQ